MMEEEFERLTALTRRSQSVRRVWNRNLNRPCLYCEKEMTSLQHLRNCTVYKQIVESHTDKDFDPKVTKPKHSKISEIVRPKIGKCPYCKTVLNDNILLFHEKECIFRPIQCQECFITTPLKDSASHYCKSPEGKDKVSEMDLLCKNFKDLFSNEICWDTTLKVQGKEFKVHKAILVARSSVFSSMFQHDTSEKQTGTVIIPDCDPDSFQMFLEYLYCGKLEVISVDSALHMYYTSDKYDVQELKTFCTKYLMQNLTVQNICKVITLADKYDEEKLLSAAQDFFNNNLKEILMTYEWEDLFKNNFSLANSLLIEMADDKQLL